MPLACMHFVTQLAGMTDKVDVIWSNHGLRNLFDGQPQFFEIVTRVLSDLLTWL